MKRRNFYRAAALLLSVCLLFSAPGVSRAAQISETEQQTERETEAFAEPESGETTDLPADTEFPADEEPESGETTEGTDRTATEDLSEEDAQTEPEEEPESGEEDEEETKRGRESDEEDEEEEDEEDDGESDDIGVIEKPDDEEEQTDHSDAAGNYASNIIAGNDVYLSELSSVYRLSFDTAFSEVMDEIESDYREYLAEPDAFLAENWQDVLAVYLMRYGNTGGVTQMNADTKDDLERIFFMMNLQSSSAMVRRLALVNGQDEEQDAAAEETDTDSGKEYYALSAEDFVTLYGATQEERSLLEKYTSTKCNQLCTIVTASKGFVRAGTENLSEERVAIVAAACSLIGKVGYFWGGKSYAIGWDSRWGDPMTVSAEGSESSGTVRSYGLDCSGFVAWAYYNGLGGSDAGIGNHTTTQWDASEMVDSEHVKPGDLVFYRPGSAGDDNHVGLVLSVNDNGSLLVVHCSSYQNGVVTGEAWSSGFQYVRSPLRLS